MRAGKLSRVPCLIADLCHDSGASSPHQQREKETDPHKLAQRQKQIDYGKNTLGYQNYARAWPRRERCGFTGRPELAVRSMPLSCTPTCPLALICQCDEVGHRPSAPFPC